MRTFFTCGLLLALALEPALAARLGRGGGGVRAGGGGGNRMASTNIQRPSNLNRGGNFNGGANVNRNANFNSNRNFNDNRNINANVNRNVNINVDNNWNHGCCGYGYNHPVAAGMAFGAAAAVTAAAIGSMVYSLPPSCVDRVYPSGTYYSCGGTWYQPQYSGTQVTYVVVNNPG